MSDAAIVRLLIAGLVLEIIVTFASVYAGLTGPEASSQAFTAHYNSPADH